MESPSEEDRIKEKIYARLLGGLNHLAACRIVDAVLSDEANSIFAELSDEEKEKILNSDD